MAQANLKKSQGKRQKRKNQKVTEQATNVPAPTQTGSRHKQKQALSEETIIDSDDDGPDTNELAAGMHQMSSAMTLGANGVSHSNQTSGSDTSNSPDGEADTESEGERQVMPNEPNPRTNGIEGESQVSQGQSQPDFSSLDDDRPFFDFKPPDKFKLIPTDYASIGNKFDSQHLAGKQLVFLTAPETVSIKKINQVAWNRISNGTETFEQKEVVYNLNLDDITSTKGMRVLLPTREGYKSVHAKINHIIRIQQLPSLKRLADPRADTEAGDRPQKIPKREQPVLKQRFRPIGAPVVHRHPVEPVNDHATAAAVSSVDEENRRKERKIRQKDKSGKKSSSRPVESGDMPAANPSNDLELYPDSQLLEKKKKKKRNKTSE